LILKEDELLLKDFAIILFGFILLIKGSEYMIDAASKLAKSLKVPAFIIGFSIVAFGTSAPELIIGIVTGVSKTNHISMGDVLGSSIANIALVIAIAAIIKPIHIEKTIIIKEMPLMFAVQIFLLFIFFIGGVLSKIDGIILLLSFIVFLFYIYTRSKTSLHIDDEDINDQNNSITKKESRVKLIIILILSIASVVLGGNFVVVSSTGIARSFGVSEFIIGLTLVAVGTSLPELITTIIAIIKGKDEIAVGNIIGSNIFNVLLVLGVSSSINPIDKMKGVEWDFVFVFGSTILLFLLSFRKKQLKRYSGIILLIFYLSYLALKVI